MRKFAALLFCLFAVAGASAGAASADSAAPSSITGFFDGN